VLTIKKQNIIFAYISSTDLLTVVMGIA